MNYSINMDVKFEPLVPIDISKLISGCTERWWNQSLSRVNDCVVRLGVFDEGEFHWHSHEKEDEFFFVLEGNLLLDLDDKTFELPPMQGILVPRGIRHRTRAKIHTVVLMVEAATVTPTGD
jgi:mannose-6-phosphate isomerase-like protein (cupin superfamily)